MKPARATAVTTALVATMAALGACSSAGTETGDNQRVTVLAAASLAGVMPDLVEQAHQRHPGRTYEVSYAGSSQIVRQLGSGARADAVVLAGEGPLGTLEGDLDHSEPVIVATNSLLIALAPGNPGGIERFEDLADDEITLVVCAEQVPCGQATQQVFDAAGLSPRVSSYEPDVRATLSKVTSGEADAAMVYVTDVEGRDLPTVPVPHGVDVLNRYPAFSVEGSRAGADFVAGLASSRSRDTLRDAGFGLP
ncbi:MAG: substrate-binding domain-containing protein [Ornithinimicrobium sp.]